MKITHLLATVALAATPAMGVATQAAAHDGSHPFENCTAAKEAGYSNIPKGDEHYASKLDRDGDGWGCDSHGTLTNDGKAETGYFAEAGDDSTDEKTEEAADKSNSVADDEGENLAETGGSGATPYIAGAAAVLLVSGGCLALRKKRRT